MESLLLAVAVRDVGFEGCAHGRLGSHRQVLLADMETLDALALQPGMIRENITTQGINVNGLAQGESLRIGEAVLEVTIPCTPCGQLEDLRPGLRKEIRGRRGMFCRVIQAGSIREGDSIERLTVSVAAV